MTSGSKPGGALPMLLLLLAILCGGGAYNYQRNVALEKQEPRPYRGYTDEQLEQLAAAYEGEKAKDSQRYEKASSRRATAQGKAYFQDQVDEFERVQRAGAGRNGKPTSLLPAGDGTPRNSLHRHGVKRTPRVQRGKLRSGGVGHAPC